MSCLENLIGKPVIVQLGDPIASAGSRKKTEVEVDGVKEECGDAIMAVQQVPQRHPETGETVVGQQPVLVQILKGEIASSSDDGIVMSTEGAHNTPLLVYIPMENVRAVTFAMAHVEPEQVKEGSQIIQP